MHIFSRAALDPDHIEVHHTKALQRPNFVSALCHAVPAGLGAASGILLAACLDNSLKVYATEKMRLRSSMTWSCGVVTAMLYNRYAAAWRCLQACSMQHHLCSWLQSKRFCFTCKLLSAGSSQHGEYSNTAACCAARMPNHASTAAAHPALLLLAAPAATMTPSSQQELQA